MKLKWLGHACFLVTAEDGARVITDPYEPGFLGLINYDAIEEEADVVTASHAHGDHDAVQAVLGQPEVVKGAGSHRAKGIEFTGYESFHDRAGGKERGRNTIFCFEVDGVRLCHVGDLGHALDEAAARAMGRVDVLLVPVGGPPATLDLDEAWQVCHALQPRVIVPMHFKNDKCSFPRYTVDDFVKGRANVRRAGAAEVTLSASGLPQVAEILVLDHAR